MTVALQAHQPSGWQRWLAWLSVAWGGGLWWFIASPNWGLWSALTVAFGLAVSVGIASRNPFRWIWSIGVGWLCIGTIAAIGVAGSVYLQWLGFAASLGLVAWGLRHSEMSVAGSSSRRALQLLVAASLGLSWFSMASFGAGLVWWLAWWWLPVAGFILLILSASLLFSGSGLTWSRYRGSLPLIGLSGAALMAATWALPTLAYVASIVGTTVATLWLMVLNHVWLGSWEPGRGRRYAWVGAGIVVAVLSTARWN